MILCMFFRPLKWKYDGRREIGNCAAKNVNWNCFAARISNASKRYKNVYECDDIMFLAPLYYIMEKHKHYTQCITHTICPQYMLCCILLSYWVEIFEFNKIFIKTKPKQRKTYEKKTNNKFFYCVTCTFLCIVW